MDDLISRQAAISHVDDVPYIKDHPNVGLLWKAWIESLPSAQPEIIRCKDCKQFRRWIDTDTCFCDITEAEISDNDFCSKAERRTDE